MAGNEQDDGSATLKSTTHISIPQLTPLLPTPSLRSIRATVAIVWPYSSLSGALTVLLAEPDIRLRRNRGQVRVVFGGSIAQSVLRSGLGSGDEVLLSLEGVEWIRDDGAAQIPGKGVEWELKFTEKLLMEVSQLQALNGIYVNTKAPRFVRLKRKVQLCCLSIIMSTLFKLSQIRYPSHFRRRE